jgi:iron(III) transport system substrate-binding protein
MADPRFGSTSFHVAALYALVARREDGRLLHRLKENGVRIVDGNSAARDLVARGDVKVGLTDTDDVNVAIEGAADCEILPDRDGLGVPVMPNMVSLIANAPHVEEAEAHRLPPVCRRRAAARAIGSCQIPQHAGVQAEEHSRHRHSSR